MAIIIDDGTFLIGNSFVEISFADAYHLLRNNTDWATATTTEKEAALAKAFDFLAVQNWISTTFTTEIPLKVQNAQCVGALKELETANSLQPDDNKSIKRKSIEGVMETEYFSAGTNSAPPTAVYNLIKPYLRYAGMSRTLVRG